MIHRLENRDVVKPLIIPNRDGTYSDIIKSTCIFYDGSLIYDTDGYLWRLYSKARDRGIKVPSIHHKCFMCIDINGQIKFTKFGRTIEALLPTPLPSPWDNRLLHINMTNTQTPSGIFPSYDTSEMIKSGQYKPLIDSEDINDWVDYITRKQEFYLTDYLSRYNIFKHIKEVDTCFWPGAVRELQQEDRYKKLEGLLKDE